MPNSEAGFLKDSKRASARLHFEVVGAKLGQIVKSVDLIYHACSVLTNLFMLQINKLTRSYVNVVHVIDV